MFTHARGRSSNPMLGLPVAGGHVFSLTVVATVAVVVYVLAPRVVGVGNMVVVVLVILNGFSFVMLLLLLQRLLLLLLH